MGDGEYWIDPEGNGKSLKVYCDMTTAGGKLPNAAVFKELISFQCWSEKMEQN